VFPENPHISETEQFTRFILVSMLALGASMIVIQLLTSRHFFTRWQKLHPLLEKHWNLLAKIAAIGVTMIINYTGYRFFAFGF
jgi:putative flippase GtrA